MHERRPRIVITLALAGLLLAAGLISSPGLNPAIGPRSADATAGLGFAMPVPQDQIAHAPEMDSAAPQMAIPPKIKAKREKDLRKYRFEKMKDHAAELAKLSAALKEDLDKSNENILSLDVVEKAQEIEKLAKKIQSEAKL